MSQLKIFRKDVCFVFKITSCVSTSTAGGPGPLHSNSIISSTSISLNNVFFKSILWLKNWRAEGELLLLKNGRIHGYTYANFVFARGPRHFGNFRNMSNIDKDQKNSYHLSSRPLTRACERGVQGVHRTWARAQGARKSSGFRVNFWYRTTTP